MKTLPFEQAPITPFHFKFAAQSFFSAEPILVTKLPIFMSKIFKNCFATAPTATLAAVSLAEERSRTFPRFYFNLKKERENLAKNQTNFTSAVSLIIGLNEDTETQCKKKGLENIIP